MFHGLYFNSWQYYNPIKFGRFAINSIYTYFKPQDFRNFHQNDQSSSSDFSDVETDDSSGRRPADADSGDGSFEIGQEVRLHGLTGKLISIFNGRVEEKNHL
jgi:hypothetical protein